MFAFIIHMPGSKPDIKGYCVKPGAAEGTWIKPKAALLSPMFETA